MDAAPGHDLPDRGAPGLLRQLAALERLASDDGPSGRLRLERELGLDLATFLLGALARPGGRDDSPVSVSLCA